MNTYKVRCDSCQATVINGHACHESGCTGVMKYIKNGREYLKYGVWCLDVWGNAREGFEVNDRSRCATIMVRSGCSDADIIRALKHAGLLNKRCRFSSFTLYGEHASLQLDAMKTGEPLYQLEAA